MCKKLIYLVFVFSLLGLAGNVQAVVNWDDGGTGSSWDTANNWDTDTVPVNGRYRLH